MPESGYIVSAESLRWLNERTKSTKYTAERFRPNIVVQGAGHMPGRPLAGRPFEEDSWARFRIGSVEFEFLKHTGRCLVPTLDPQTAERDAKAEPLLTLKRLRGGVYDFLPPSHESHDVKEAFFAVGCRHVFVPGQKLRIGDKVVVREFRSPQLVKPLRTDQPERWLS